MAAPPPAAPPPRYVLQALKHHEDKRVVSRYVGWGNVLAFNEGRPSIKVRKRKKVEEGV